MRRTIPLILILVVACGSDTADTTTTAPSPTSSTDPTTTTVGPTTTVASTTTTAPATTTTTAPEDPYRFEITVNGTDVEGGGRIDVPLGETVTFVVTADVDDHVHVHGYDLFLDLTPGEPGEITFETTIPGTVEIELEDAGVELVLLTSS